MSYTPRRRLGLVVRAIAGVLAALVRLLLLVGAVLGVAFLLLAIDGPPRLPERWPDWNEILLNLQLGGVPTSVILYVVVQFTWLVLGYLVLISLLEVVVTILDTLAAGVAGVRRLKRATDALAPGIVRQTVVSLITAVLTVWLSLRPPAPAEARAAPVTIELVQNRPVVAANPQPTAPAPLAVAVDGDGTMRLLTPADRAALAPGARRYTVVKGDNLIDIALRLYGDGSYQAAMEIFRANEGRTMPSGRVVDDPRLIYPGEVLIIPARASLPRPFEVIEHVVQPGETLTDIAGRYLGDATAWPTIFKANRGRPAPNGRVLTDPHLIWPGTLLRFPRALQPEPAQAPSAREEPAPATDSQSLPTVVDDWKRVAVLPGAEALGIADPAAGPGLVPPSTHDWTAEAAAARIAQTRLQAEAEAEARANAAAGVIAGPTPVATPLSMPNVVSPDPTVAARAATSAGGPAESTGASESVMPVLGWPITAGDIPLAGVLSGAAALIALLGYRGYRRYLARTSDPDDARRLPIRFPALSALDPRSGLTSQPLAPLARQRRHGIEADPRHVVTSLVLEALARAGWPAAQVISLCAGDQRLVYRLALGAPPPIMLDPLLEHLNEELQAVVDARLGDRDELWLTLRELSPSQAWSAQSRLPLAPLLTVGQAEAGLLSIAIDALDGGLLLAGQHSLVALERALLSLVALYPPADLRVVLLAGDPLAGWLASLPHLRDAPRPAGAAGAAELIGRLHEELRCRQIGSRDAGSELILLAIDQPHLVDGAALRDLVRDGSRYGIYTLLASATPELLGGALLDACPGRLVTGLDSADLSVRLCGQPGGEALPPGQAWWRLAGEPVQPVRVLRIVPEDRQALLAAMAGASTPTPPPAPTDSQADNQSVADPVDVASADHHVSNGHGPRTTNPAAANGHATGDGPAANHGHVGSGNGHEAEIGALPRQRLDTDHHPAATNGVHDLTSIVQPGATSTSAAGLAHAAGPADGDSAPPVAGESPVLSARPDSPVTTPVAQPSAEPPAGQPDTERHLAASPAATLPGRPARPLAPNDATGASVAALPGARYGPRPGMLRLRLCGSPRLYDEHDTLITFGRHQTMCWRFLLFLALQGATGAVLDAVLAGLWWAEIEASGDGDADELADDEADGRARLNAAKVRRLRDRLRDYLADWLPPDSEKVVLRSGIYMVNDQVIWTDLGAFTACLTQARRLPPAAALPLVQEALTYYPAEIARDLPLHWFDSRWLDQRRGQVAEEARQASLWAAAALVDRDDYAGAITLYQRLRAETIVDDEVAQYELICQALRGDRALIRHSFEDHVAALARVSERPRTSTVTLYTQLMAGQVEARDLRQRLVSSAARP